MTLFKTILNCIDYILWTIVLLISIVILTRGEQIPSLMAMMAILMCYMDRFAKIIQHEQITVEVTTTKDELKEEANERQD